MPYNKRSDLPGTVKRNLPAHAEKIYKEAFNSAYDEYKDPNKRRGNVKREEVAHKVAWSAVKKIYKKDKNGDWVKK